MTIFREYEAVFNTKKQSYSKIGKLLNLLEAFENIKRGVGETPFKHSSLDDPHIREIVDAASKKTGISAAEIDEKIKKELSYIEDLKKYSFLLYDTAAKNSVETAAFKLIDHVVDKPEFQSKRVVFNPIVFKKLIDRILLEHYQFTPIRAPGEIGSHSGMSPIIVPSNNSSLKHFNSIETAAATSKGEFIFNKIFMQRLLDFAVVENLLPPVGNPGKKYISNGGKFPDAYAYIEFLIIHELLHYTYGDFKVDQNRRYKDYNHKIHNYAGDFRSNYMLVKSGYPQLPIGLFSDHINLDRQTSYGKLLEIIQQEVNKLPDKLRKKFERKNKLDSHPKQPLKPKPPYEPSIGDIVRLPDNSFGQVTKVDMDGTFDTKAISKEEASRILNYPVGKTLNEALLEGQWNPNQVTLMKPYKPKEDGEGEEDGDTENEDGSDDEDGEDEPNNGDPDEENDIDMDAVHQDIEDKLAKGVDSNIDNDEEKLKNNQSQRHKESNKQLVLNKKEVEYSPKIGWKQLMKYMFQSPITTVDTSYTRPARSSVSRIPSAIQTGSMAVNPGERTREENYMKICLVFDTSGSMYSTITKALGEARSLIKQMNKPDIQIGIVFFSDAYRGFKADLLKNNYADISTIEELNKPMSKSVHNGWENVLHLAGSGGTIFSTKLSNDLATLASQGWNVILFSDSDIMWDKNWSNFSSLWRSHKNNIHFIADDSELFKQCCAKLGIIPKTWTHM